MLIVATWFPSVDDPGAGRFVADQAEALLAAGSVRPSVISFDPVRLTGVGRARIDQEAAVLAAGRAAIAAAEPLFLRPAWGVHPDLPVARLSIAEGASGPTGPAHAAIHRETLLWAVGERLAAEPGFAGAGFGVVHAHTGYPDGAAAIALADALGWPLVVTEHASFVNRLIASPELHERYTAVLRRADRLFAVSETLAAELRAAFPAFAATIGVLPNAVPIERFARAPVGDRRPDELLFVGYRKASKGIETLLRGVAVARAARPSITLRLVGRASSDEEDASWRALADELEMGPAVTFERDTDRAGVAAAMARASVFVHASPRETFGVVAVEALASGLPVVATDSGGVTEILGAEPDLLGALVPVDDPEAFGAAILRTLERRAAFDPARLRAAVAERFSAELVADRLHDAYGEAVARWAGSRDGSAAGAGATGAVSPTLAVPPGRPVVVALDRSSAARRLAALPQGLRDELTLVAAVEPADIDLPAVGRVLTVAIEAGWRPISRTGFAARRGWIGRVARVLSDPVGTLRRRSERAGDGNAWLAPASAAIAGLVASSDEDPSGGRMIELIAVDGHDALAIAPSLGSSAGVRSGVGLRRLADRSIPKD